MKRHYITLGAIAIMLLASGHTSNASISEFSTTLHQSICQSTSIRQTVIDILSDCIGTEVNAGYLSCSFRELGMDSLDFIEFNEKVEEATNAYIDNADEYYNQSVNSYILEVERNAH